MFPKSLFWYLEPDSYVLESLWKSVYWCIELWKEFNIHNYIHLLGVLLIPFFTNITSVRTPEKPVWYCSMRVLKGKKEKKCKGRKRVYMTQKINTVN